MGRGGGRRKEKAQWQAGVIALLARRANSNSWELENGACSGCTQPHASPQSLAGAAQAGFQSPLLPLPRALFSEQPAQLWPADLERGRPVPNAVEDESSQGTEISEEVKPVLGYGYKVWWVYRYSPFPDIKPYYWAITLTHRVQLWTFSVKASVKPCTSCSTILGLCPSFLSCISSFGLPRKRLPELQNEISNLNLSATNTHYFIQENSNALFC